MSNSRILFTALCILAALVVLIWTMTDWATTTSAPFVGAIR